MNPEDLSIARRLLTEEQTAALGVVMEGRPYVGLVPYVWIPAQGAAVIHTSALAQHSAGLYDGAAVSLLVRATSGVRDHLQVPRVTILGVANLILSETNLYRQYKERYLARFPKATITFSLKDFSLFAVQASEARVVLGFGKAFSLSLSDLQTLFGE